MNFLSLAAVILTAPLLAALGFVFFLPVLRFWRLSADGVFPRLTWRYLVVVAYGLLLAVVLTLGEISRFPFLAAALQSIGLGAVLGFKVLEGRRGGATSDVVTEGASRRRRGSVALTLALAGIVVVTAFVYFWSPAAGFLITDACHDAGGRMLANGVCEFGPSGPN